MLLRNERPPVPVAEASTAGLCCSVSSGHPDEDAGTEEILGELYLDPSTIQKH